MDITERKPAEEKIRSYKSMVESDYDVIFFKDLKSRYVIANAKILEAFGLSKKEVIGKNDYEIMSDKEEAGKNVEDDQFVFKTGKPKEITKHMTGADGKEYWFQAIKVPQFDDKGNIVGLVCIARDITEHKRAEDELRKSEKRFRELADLLPETIFETDTKGDVKFANQIAFDFFGYTQNDFDNGLNCLQMVIPEDLDRAGKNMQRVLSGEKIGGIEYTAQSKDGVTAPVIIYVSQIIHKNKPVGMRGIVINITDLKLAEEEKDKLQAQLQQARKMEAIGTLAGGIAHDFNNLLMGIQGYASLMLSHIDSSHPHYKKLKGIKKQVQSGSRLTNQLLGYAREGRYEVKPVSLNKLVEETSETFGRTKREITIHRELARDLSAIEADHGQIEQVLLNLYVNAADAMPGCGELILKTLNTTHDDIKGKPYIPKQGNYVLLTVTDTGIGMNQETQKRIFDPFFTSKEMGTGTGLGLASAYGIIKSHGGYINVESEQGRGTTFRIYLPASEKRVRKAVKTADKIIKGIDADKIIKGIEMILLVDDEEVILEVGRGMLEGMGYRVLTAKGGREAIEVYKKKGDDIDFVILDMIMPNMGGGETYDRLREIDPDIKVLLSSGYSINGQATEILERGCDGFIQKPFDTGELSVKIREIIELGMSI